jgi:hypothetical protein
MGQTVERRDVPTSVQTPDSRSCSSRHISLPLPERGSASTSNIGMLAISGWLGGKMVHVHGVAVEAPPEPASAVESHRLGT